MTGPGLSGSGSAAAENELLAQLGLPKSASPEDLDDLHQAVSQYLASAPPELRGWAHAQAAALDEAYLQLTDPVGFGGSALRSPARPPAVVPGGPATPPARRGSDPAADPILAAASAGALSEAMTDSEAGAGIEPAADNPDVDDLALLYASVTPSAHPDMLPDAKPKARTAMVAPVAAPVRHRRASRHAAAAAPVAPPPQAANPWKRLVLAGVAVVAIIGVGFGGMQVVGAIGGSSPTPSGDVAQATQAPPAVDEAKIAALMEKLAANPKDTVTLLALADEYYAGQQFAQAGDFLDRLLAIEPENVPALLARGAVSFNLGKLDEAETTWTKVVVIDPKNVEAHYDLGFLYLNSATPDWAGVQREWNMVIELDPTSDLAKTVKSHLDSLAAASMIPAGSPAASAGAGASPGAAPSASPVESPAPSASPAASTTP
jgi:tetratricopeptide (TPR) repeat protein